MYDVHDFNLVTQEIIQKSTSDTQLKFVIVIEEKMKDNVTR